jgi:hypothetical protein
MNSRRRVNSTVMQLLSPAKRTANVALICLLAMTVGAIASCHKARDPHADSPVRVSLCELYKNPAAYDGTMITLSATMTQLPNGKYLYPGPSNDCTYSFIKVDSNYVQSNSALTELESSSAASPVRKEFDLELTGLFAGKYSEGQEAFRYRIVPINIKPQSSVRVGKRLGAA